MPPNEKEDTASIQFRFAERNDISSIVSMLADDSLGAAREAANSVAQGAYSKAFDEMEAQGINKYLLAINTEDKILGCLQITIIPGLSRGGMKRALLEGIRVTKSARGQGIGRKLMDEAHAVARRHDCGLVQLTTDRSRTEALRFYEDLGYENSHHGLKFLF